MTSREAAAHRIAVISRELYRATLSLQAKLSPELFDQLEASTLSIGSNWCEAHGRFLAGQPKGAAQFLRFARGSAYEAAFQFWCADEVELSELAHDACDELDRLLMPEPIDIDAALDAAERAHPISQASVITPRWKAADDRSEAASEENPTQHD